MDWYTIFYWVTVADGVKRFFDVASNWFTFFAIVFFILAIVFSVGKSSSISGEKLKNEEEDKKNPDYRSWDLGKKHSMKFFYTFLVLWFVTWMGYALTPTKKDCLLIIAGGSVGNFITSDSSAQKIPSDITDFLHLSLKKEIQELTVEERDEIGMQTPKEKFLDKVKELSKEELIDFLQSDTTLLSK